jgi:hypothetical protein
MRIIYNEKPLFLLFHSNAADKNKKMLGLKVLKKNSFEKSILVLATS